MRYSVLLNIDDEQADVIDEWCYDRWDVGGEDQRWSMDFIYDEKYTVEYSFTNKKDSVLFSLRWL